MAGCRAGSSRSSNIESRDPSKVREGNERVVRPRLSDAAIFWDQDRKISLDAHAARLSGVTFQTRLGTYADKTRRVKHLAELIASHMGTGRRGGPDGTGPMRRGSTRQGRAGQRSHGSRDDGLRAAAARAAELAKADLMTAMVGEFPELQGTMGRYYAEAQGEPEEVALAIEEHYTPCLQAIRCRPREPARRWRSPTSSIPWSASLPSNSRPTGAKGPFRLAPRALGVLRILLEGRLDLDLLELLEVSAASQPVHRTAVIDEVL